MIQAVVDCSNGPIGDKGYWPVSHAGEEQREKGGEGDKHEGNESIFDDNTRGQTVPPIKE